MGSVQPGESDVVDWRARKDWRGWVTNEREQREEAAAKRRAGDGAFVPDALRGELTGPAARLAIEAARKSDQPTLAPYASVLSPEFAPLGGRLALEDMR
ncbi:uncharacterized protein ATNIH1004_004263 [Aspergillus tanneri]|uniref:Uncharacterized protein n=1 Tax=Aspergillus tanneri TaxID=1220188 RepID=A0A5M9MN27_9EURO|nr:uncharacterized protein ATNIH1004_004263 [Aspergillus tanneri]KAA8648378.1 hypothetical protein ATNIH1004_004263 [Aspergillus tanneri]